MFYLSSGTTVMGVIAVLGFAHQDENIKINKWKANYLMIGERETLCVFIFLTKPLLCDLFSSQVCAGLLSISSMKIK